MGEIAIIGAGPSGLIAAESLVAAGHTVTVFDRMASPARKFLLAGRGGLNLTHTEAAARFLSRYKDAAAHLLPALQAFSPADLMKWCEGLGQEMFTGSSGRIFPRAMKAAPLLRAWLRRLDRLGVRLITRHRWRGWRADGELLFSTPEGEAVFSADAVVLALGGASWPRMGSDGAWAAILADRGVRLEALRPSNCGVLVKWEQDFLARFEGMPLKRVAVTVARETARGEPVITRTGLEGGVIYALSSAIRAELAANGAAVLHLDLRPDLDHALLSQRIGRGAGARSLANTLRQRARLDPQAAWLVRQALRENQAPDGLAVLIKAVPVRVNAMQGLERAISSAGGVAWEEVDAGLMLRRLPGVFVAGEMLDWEAPTGGYLLQACFSTGVLAARGVENWMRSGPLS